MGLDTDMYGINRLEVEDQGHSPKPYTLWRIPILPFHIIDEEDDLWMSHLALALSASMSPLDEPPSRLLRAPIGLENDEEDYCNDIDEEDQKSPKEKRRTQEATELGWGNAGEGS